MKAVLQRVDQAGVTVAGQIIGQIKIGLVILLGIKTGDTEADLEWLANKCMQLRIFEDENGKFNKSLLDVCGSVLVISQFTLFADCRQGRRPSFTDAAPPEFANAMYEKFVRYVRNHSVPVETGEFAAHMIVHIQNNGPVTITIDTEDR
jgi:D-tyrosyl-tRNA(Tyr) deacylase